MPGGRAVWEKRGGENGAEDFESFHLGNQHAESFAQMLDVFTAESEYYTGDGRIANFAEARKTERRARLNLQLSQLECGARENEGAMFDSHFFSALSRMHDPTVCGLDEAGDRGFEFHGVLEALGESVGQNLKALVERKFRGPVLGHFAALLAFARAEDLAFDE